MFKLEWKANFLAEQFNGSVSGQNANLIKSILVARMLAGFEFKDSLFCVTIAISRCSWRIQEGCVCVFDLIMKMIYHRHLKI
jgi:hypothetical protein